MYPTRYICDVFEEMRQCNKTRNYGYLAGLIEECQTLANRMEGALGEKRQLRNLHEEVRELEDKRDKLKLEVDKGKK